MNTGHPRTLLMATSQQDNCRQLATVHPVSAHYCLTAAVHRSALLLLILAFYRKNTPTPNAVLALLARFQNSCMCVCVRYVSDVYVEWVSE